MISICIPVYDGMGERGVEMLRELIVSIRMQAFTDYEIVISDADSSRDTIAMLASYGITHVPGKEGAAANLNNAIDHANGNIIKPMFQDDKFMFPDSLQKITDALESSQWATCTSYNSGIENWEHVPRVHSTLAKLREGENTYGCPSAMAWRRNVSRFDENLKWLFDCEFYARMIQKCGTPTFVDTPIFIRQWDGQATRTLCDGQARILDQNEVIEKYRDRESVAR